jgi:hypothetical protein
MKDDQNIYFILAKFVTTYSMFVSNCNVIREALGVSYIQPSLEYFFHSLIREKHNIWNLGVINTLDTSKKSLVAQQKDKTKHTKKQHPQKKRKKKGCKPS